MEGLDMHVSRKFDYDAVIIGARCAGAPTAMLLARAGARVLVVDRDRAGSDTMSTHALMRGAVFQLSKWGVLPRIIASGAPAVRRTTFHYDDEAIEVDIRPALGTEALYAPRRTVLDQILVEEAIRAGAKVFHSTSAVDLIRSLGGVIQGVRLAGPTGEVWEAHAPLVIGADGRRSWTARQVQAAFTAEASHSVDVAYCYADGLPNRGYEWFYTDRASAGVIPTNGGQCVVFLGLPFQEKASGIREADRLADEIMQQVPAVADRLHDAVLRGPITRFSGSMGFRREPVGPGWALVGDAGYFKDPITAHGITDAFRDAELLADAVLRNRLRDYAEERDRLTGEFFRLTNRIASFDWSLPELKDLHLQLNKSMKPTQERCARGLAEKVAA
jgi:flavin-dependent dehydrogenase